MSAHTDVAEAGRELFVSSLRLDSAHADMAALKSSSTPLLKQSQQRAAQSLQLGPTMTTMTGISATNVTRASTGGKGMGKPGMIYPTISAAAFQANTPLAISKPLISPKGSGHANIHTIGVPTAKKRASGGSNKMSPRSRKSSDSPAKSAPSARSPQSATQPQGFSPGSSRSPIPHTSTGASPTGKGQGRSSGKSRGSNNSGRKQISIRVSEQGGQWNDGRTSQMNADALEFVSRRSSLRAEAPEFMPIYQAGNWPNQEDFLKPKKLCSTEELEVIDTVMAWSVSNVDTNTILSPTFMIADVKVQIGVAVEVGGLCLVSLECESKTRMKFELSVNGKRSGPKVCLGKKFSTTIKLPEDEVPRRVAFQCLEIIP